MVQNMRENGMSIKSIARELSISRNSVRKYLRSEPKGKQNRKRDSKLDPYREKIRALIDDHNLSAVRILEEIRMKCFTHLWTKYEINYDPCCSLPYKWQQTWYTHLRRN